MAKTPRHQNRGLRKVCGCSRRAWPKCPHSWHFNFKVRGGPAYRFSVDTEASEHIASKTEAEGRADGWRSAIRNGTFRRRSDAPPAPIPSASPDAITLEAFGEIWFERRGKPATAGERSYMRRLVAFTPPVGETRLGLMSLGAITEDAIEAFFVQLRADGRAGSTVNKYVQLVKAMFRWGAKKGYGRNVVAESEAIRRVKHAKRSRRLVADVVDEQGQIVHEGEERRLLAAAAPQLQRVLVGALETGMRRGELLALRWADVNLVRREITLRAATTKTRTGRVLPISSRLGAVMEMAKSALVAVLRSGPAKDLDERALAAVVAPLRVFGDEVGLPVGNIKRAWETAVLKAHGHTPKWTGSKGLDAASRAALRSIDLHFHDLRHEAGSRLLEAGWPLHHVQEMLGHANVSQTSTYLNATRIGLHDSMRRFNDARCNPVASDRPTDPSPACNDTNEKPVEIVVN